MTTKRNPRVPSEEPLDVQLRHLARSWAAHQNGLRPRRPRSRRQPARFLRFVLRAFPLAFLVFPLAVVVLAVGGVFGILASVALAVFGAIGAVFTQVPCLVVGLLALGYAMRRRWMRPPALPAPDSLDLAPPPSAADTVATAPTVASVATPAPSSSEGEFEQLPERTGAWLNAQRAALPVSSWRHLDAILQHLPAITPQLAGRPASGPIEAELRSLLAEELPELVRAYLKLPATLRNVRLHGGATPEEQLLAGLTVVEQQLTRLHQALARGDLEALAVHQRYLDLKYKREGGL